MRRTLLAAVAALSIGTISPVIADPAMADAATQRPQVASGADAAQQAPSTPASARRDNRAWLFPPVGNYLNQRPG